jgi:hypothetical protein
MWLSKLILEILHLNRKHQLKPEFFITTVVRKIAFLFIVNNQRFIRNIKFLM